MAFHTNVGHLKCCQQTAVYCQDTGKPRVTGRNYFQAAAFHLKQRIQTFKAAFYTQNHSYHSMLPKVAVTFMGMMGVGNEGRGERKERKTVGGPIFKGTNYNFVMYS